MPTVAEIQAAQAAAAAAAAGAGSGTGAGAGSGAGTGSGAGSGTGSVVGRTVALRAGLTSANLREGPSTETERVGLFTPSETAKIIEVKDDWYRVEFSFGMTAWIRNDLVVLR